MLFLLVVPPIYGLANPDGFRRFRPERTIHLCAASDAEADQSGITRLNLHKKTAMNENLRDDQSRQP
jgi:hypothetical protein